MLTDYHSHPLPAMDDGPEDAQSSLRMLDMWRDQGVKRVVATPHFYPHREPAADFLARREKSRSLLAEAGGHPVILFGAEVYLEKGISEIGQARELALAGSNHILLELPYAPFAEWMIAETYNLMYNYGLTPMFAHIDRYLRWYSKDEIARVLAVREAVLQINNQALFSRATRKFALELVRGGFKVVLGSDAHSADDRPPNVDAAQRVLRSKLTQPELSAVMERNEKLV